MANLTDLVERYVDRYNSEDIDAMLDCVSDDVVFENISNTGQSIQLKGRDAMRQVAEASASAFKYRRQKIVSLMVNESSAAAEVSFNGIAAVNLPTGIRAGQSVDMRGATFFEFRDGKIARIADYS